MRGGRGEGSGVGALGLCVKAPPKTSKKSQNR